jgi:hypothetical protein
MIKISNNLLKLAKTNLPLHRNPLIVGAGTGLLGGGVGAGLFHLMAKEEDKSLLNYLLAASSGALPAGYLGYAIQDSFNWRSKNPANTPQEAIPGAIAEETEDAEKAKKDS